jgi:hypothetical protein
MKAIFHPEALEEMIESARFYEGKWEGLGSDFLTAVEETTHRLEQFTEAGSIERANIRQRLVSGSPFTLLLRNTARSHPHRSGDASTSSAWLSEKAVAEMKIR